MVFLACMFSLFVLQSVNAAVEWDTFFEDNFMRTIPGIGPFIAESPDRTLMQFYPVENWEIEVCSREVTSMKKRSDNNNNLDTPRIWYDGASIAIAGSYYKYSATNEVLYNADWYVQPRDRNIKYSIYLKSLQSGEKLFLKEYSNITTGAQASIGAISKVYNVTYDIIGIQYSSIDELGTVLSTDFLEADLAESEAEYG